MTTADTRDEAIHGDRYANWKGWDADRFGQYSRSDARYFDWHVRRCLSARAPSAAPVQVLEIGFGNGSFMGWARDRGYQVTGTEIQPLLLERARAAGWSVAPGLPPTGPKRHYDLIVAFDVLEHLARADWPAVMEQMTSHLDANGRVLIRVPNGDSPFGRLNQHGDITHVTTFGTQMLRQLAALHGLELLAHGEAPWHCRQGMSRTLTNALRAGLRALLEKWIRFAFAWTEVSMAPNLVVVLGHRRGTGTPSTREPG